MISYILKGEKNVIRLEGLTSSCRLSFLKMMAHRFGEKNE